MKNNKQKLFKYLKSQRLMSLSTFSDKPWTSTVYYTNDGDFNLYFLSEPESKHCHDIFLNPFVACNIADSTQKVTDKKIGVQIQGTAKQITDEGLIKKVLAAWNKANPGFEHIINFDNMKKKVIKSKVYKITPKIIKFFNEQIYGPEGSTVYKF